MSHLFFVDKSTENAVFQLHLIILIPINKNKSLILQS